MTVRNQLQTCQQTKGNKTNKPVAPLRANPPPPGNYIKSSYNRLKQFQNKFHNHLISIHLPPPPNPTLQPLHRSLRSSVCIVRLPTVRRKARTLKFTTDQSINADSRLPITLITNTIQLTIEISSMEEATRVKKLRVPSNISNKHIAKYWKNI